MFTDRNGQEDDGNPFGAAETALLDQAAGYAPGLEDEHALHQGALDYAEDKPGNFWSIRVVDCHKSFGRAKILQGVDLGIPEGMITVIVGPSGTGKSVMIKHLIGLMFPDKGDVIVHGESLRNMTLSRLLDVRKKFGILFQDGALFGSMSVYDNVAFPLRQHTDLSEPEIAAIVNERLADVGLSAAAGKLPNELSGGMKKRAGFARALVLEPDIVMFDEPDSGLDPVRTALLGQLLVEQHALYGGTIVVVTHNVLLARQIGEHISVVWQGRVLESGMTETIIESGSEFVRQFLSGSSRGPLGMDA